MSARVGPGDARWLRHTGLSGRCGMSAPSLKRLMTPFPYAVELDDPLERARALMQRHRIHHLPVTREHRPVGLVSDREIAAYAEGPVPGATGRLPRVRDVYVPDACIVDINMPLDEVLQSMAERRQDVAIVTRKGSLAGVLTGIDVCRFFAAWLRERYPRPGGGDIA